MKSNNNMLSNSILSISNSSSMDLAGPEPSHWSKDQHNIILQNKIHSNSFHSAMRLSLRIAQCFGMFPLSMNGDTTHFKWLYWRTLYSIITLLLFIEECAKVVHQDLQKYLNILTIDSMFFYITAVTHCFLLFRLSMEWPSYVKEWHRIEAKSKNYENIGNLKVTLNTITLSILTLATVEHYLINGYILKTCLENTATLSEAFERYFRQSYGSAFIIIKYAFWKGLVFEFVNMQMAFLWNFVDIFIMLIGTALKFRIQQLSHRLRLLTKVKMMNKNAWRSIRKDYLLVTSLCQSTNSKVSSLIMMSFLVNLYFVLKQIFRSLTRLENSVEKAYFYVSFALLVIRITCVIIFGSGVHDEWKELGLLVHNVHSSAYNEEVERFLTNISTYELVLSGKNFFSIRRSLILQIAGTVVTYELVIIQFHTEMLKNTA